MTSTTPESLLDGPRYFQPKNDAPIPAPKPLELMTTGELIALVKVREADINRLKEQVTAMGVEIDACNEEILVLQGELDECQDDGR